MEARHFVFLGYRHYRLERGASQDRLVPDARSGLGILRAATGSAAAQGEPPCCAAKCAITRASASC